MRCRQQRFRLPTPRAAWLVVPGLLALLGACSSDGDYPRGWSPLMSPAKESGVANNASTRNCPEMSGRYRVNDSIIFRHLVARRMTREQREISWFSVDFSGSTGDSLRAVIARNNLRDTVWLVFGEDFDCSGGWLTGSWPEYALRMRPSDVADDSRSYESRLYTARDIDGRLIGRLSTVSFAQFAVWCGDGCKYVKVPFTRAESVRWHRMSPERLADGDAAETMIQPASAAQLAREDAALEAGAPAPMDSLGARASARARTYEARSAEQVRRVENDELPHP